jgi:hypothetical protein
MRQVPRPQARLEKLPPRLVALIVAMPPRKPSAIAIIRPRLNLTSSLAKPGAMWFSPHACCADRRIHRASPYGCVCTRVSPRNHACCCKASTTGSASPCETCSRGRAVSTGAAGWRNDAKWPEEHPPASPSPGAHSPLQNCQLTQAKPQPVRNFCHAPPREHTVAGFESWAMRIVPGHPRQWCCAQVAVRELDGLCAMQTACCNSKHAVPISCL